MAWKLVKRKKNPDGTITDTYKFLFHLIDDDTKILKPNGVKNKAYFITSSDTSAKLDVDDATTEFTNYSIIQNDDGDYSSFTAYSTDVLKKGYVINRYVFDMSRFLGISSITYRWDGYFSYNDLATVAFKHKETSGWVTDSTSIPTSDGAGWEVEVTLTNISDIVINGKFEFGFVAQANLQETTRAYITAYVDAVEVEVTYTSLLQTVTDSVKLSDEVLVNKQTSVSDNISLSDEVNVYAIKVISVEDSISLSDEISVNKTLPIEDRVSLSDKVSVDKYIVVEDNVKLSDNVSTYIKEIEYEVPLIFIEIGDLLITGATIKTNKAPTRYLKIGNVYVAVDFEEIPT